MSAALELSARTLAARRELVTIDIREPSERHPPIGFIPGSLSLPASRFAQEASALEEILPLDTPLALCCLTGKRSARLAADFAALGYWRLFNLKGGLLAWTEAELPLCGLHTLPPVHRPLSPEQFERALVSCFVAAVVESDLDNETAALGFNPRALISQLLEAEQRPGRPTAEALERVLHRTASEAWRRGHPLDRIAENVDHMQGLLGGVAA